MKDKINIGVVADWLVTYAGAERVLSEMFDIFPDAELYSIVDFCLMKRVSISIIKRLRQHLFKIYHLLRANIKTIYH